MSKKIKRVPYELDASGIKTLPFEEIQIILRGADELIMTGGRAMLAKILAGSKEKKLLELELDYCPVYGRFKGQSQKEILKKIDWMILNGYLEIDYDYKLPLLVFTKKGWEIARETYADELFANLLRAAASQRYEFVETLRERNRGMILLLLDKIAASGKKELITILDAWRQNEYKKVKTRISEVMKALEKVEDEVIEKQTNDYTLSFSANKKWLAIPKDFRVKLEQNVFCGTCLDVVQIKDYIVKEDGENLLLEGKCNRCENRVVRVIE